MLVIGVLAYASLILLLRASGKRTLSKMNAFDFIVTVALGSTLASVARYASPLPLPLPLAGKITDDLSEHFSLGSQRSLEQDVGFGLRQIVAIAPKALSPGINDTTISVNWPARKGRAGGGRAARRLQVARKSACGPKKIAARPGGAACSV